MNDHQLLQGIYDRIGTMQGETAAVRANLGALQKTTHDGLSELRRTVELVRQASVQQGNSLAAHEQRMTAAERRISSLQRTVGDQTGKIEVDRLRATERSSRLSQTWKVLLYVAAGAAGATSLLLGALKLAGCA